MAAISETHAALRFFGDDLEPDQLSAHLGGTPSTCARKGEVIRSEKTGRERVARTGSWIMEVARREPGDLDGQVQELLAPLTRDFSIWRSLGQYRPDLFVGMFLQESNEGIEISAESLSALGERGIRLAIDVYEARPELRNIQIIDGADNATFSVFQATDAEFNQLFPTIGQDMEISEDFVQRVGEAVANRVFEAIWERPILKRDANGIHGTIFFNSQSRRQHMPASKREVDLDERSINSAQRKLFAESRKD
jgi:hypothetical protein